MNQLRILALALAVLAACGAGCESDDPQTSGPPRSRLRALLDELTSDNADVRQLAAEALGRMGNPKAIDALIGALADESPSVRRSAASALGEIGSAQAVDALATALRDLDGEVARAAIRALGEIGTSEAAKALAQGLDDPIRAEHIRQALAAIADRAAVAKAVGEARPGDRDPYEAWIGQLKAPMLAERVAAIESLGLLGDKRAVAPLLTVLTEDESQARQAAVAALGMLRDDRAVKPLIAVLSEPEPELQAIAASVLGSLGDQQAVEPLRNALTSNDSNVRSAAAEALRQLGHLP